LVFAEVQNDNKMTFITDFLFHFESWLSGMMQLHPMVIGFIFFAILFAESAFLPLAPFLPGDGLLFGIGVFAANGFVDLFWIIPVLIFGGILGNWVAYLVGQRYGMRIFKSQNRLTQTHFDQTVSFYSKHGHKAFLLSRFIPVVRSLVPLLAGIAQMKRTAFLINNVLSVSLWVVSITLFAYFLGELSFVKHHFTMILIAVGISCLLIILWIMLKKILPKAHN
jgi:membrane-associated protein